MSFRAFPPAVIATHGREGDTHRCVVSRIPSPDDRSFQGHAVCDCGWLTVQCMPHLADTAAREHLEAHSADAPAGAT